MPMRRGSSLAELVVAMTVGGLLAALLFGLLGAQIRLARETARRIAIADAVRVTNHVVAGEVRRMAPQDLRALSRDSMGIRAFRGAAIVCAGDGEHLGVRFRGDRTPDPVKDSLLVVSPFAAERAVRLVDQRHATVDGCVAMPGETVMSWTVQPATDVASVLLLFESGNYYLTAGALRYRLGAEGRQPVTTELFLPPFTRFVAGSEAGFSLDLAAEPGRHFRIPIYFGTVAP
jgi:type II secretory pathway pseudopilin PulG